MRFKRHIELEKGIKQIEIAPLIDTVFLLLIFFLLTSNFIIQPGVRLNLPKTVTGEFLQPEKLEIIITAENLLFFDNRLITSEELSILINQAAKRKQSMLIKADSRASLGKAAEIWDIARLAGIPQVNIATSQ